MTAGHATAAPAPIWFLRVPRTLLTQPHMCTLLHTTTAFKSMSFSRRALPRAPRAPRTEVRPLVARARWVAAVNGRGEAWAVGLAKRPLALRAVVVSIGAQANHGRADGLRRAGRVLCVGVALREEALRGGGAVGRGAHERVESGGVAA